MSRQQARFRIIEPFSAPRGRGYALSVITSQQWPMIPTKRGVVRVDIDTAATQPQTHAVFPDWSYGNDDTHLCDWTRIPVAGEDQAVAAARDILGEQLQDLQDKIADLPAGQAPAEADLQRVWELEQDRDLLDQQAFWDETWNSFGDGCDAIYRACNTANVPYRLRSNWRLKPDRPFTVFFHRCRPHEQQTDCSLRIRFGHWALVFKQEKEVQLIRYKDGQYYEDDTDQPERGLGQWITYNGTDFDTIDAWEAQIAAIQDEGRLTIEDKAYIADLHEQVDTKKRALKKDGLAMTATEKDAANAAIKALKDQIRERKESKRGLDKDQEARVARIKKGLYEAETSVQFERMAESMFGSDLTVTIIPQRRGFMVLNCSRGKDYFVFEDDDVTSRGGDETIVAATPIQVDGNGGAFWFRTSYIMPSLTATLESDVLATGQGSPVGAVADLNWDASVMPGTTIAGVVTPLSRGRFQWSIKFTTDGAQGYLPFLYRLYLNVQPSPRDRALEKVVFNSSAAPALEWEIGHSQEKENRGRAATLSIFIPARKLAEYDTLRRLSNHQIAYDEGGPDVFTGVVGEKTETETAAGVKLEYRCYDRWYILRKDRVFNDVVGDGVSLATYFRWVARGAGFCDDEIIVSGRATERLLPRGKPGDEPAVRPEWGGARADFMTRLLEDFGYGLDMWFDGRGRLHLEPKSTVTKPIRYSSVHRTLDDRRVMRDLERTEDWADFVNDLTVVGKKIGGSQLCRRYTDFASIFTPGSAKYVGRLVADQPHQNDALVTQELVDACAYWRADERMRPMVTLKFTTDYDDTISVGDRFYCDDEVVSVLGGSSDERSSGSMSLTVRVV